MEDPKRDGGKPESLMQMTLRLMKEKQAEEFAARAMNGMKPKDESQAAQQNFDVNPISYAEGPSIKIDAKNTWDEHALRQLLNESNGRDMTQKKLAEKYGISRQAIAKALGKAKDQFKAPRESWVSPIAQVSKSKRK